MEDNIMANERVDYQAITKNQKETWGAARYQPIALQIMDTSEDLIRTVDPHPKQRVLDLACGTGNGALVAARRDCDVVGIDYAPSLIEQARERANAEGLDIDFRIDDVQKLPFPEESFDVVISLFGVMFAPDQEKAASEMLRVCKPGGKIGLVSWPPNGYASDLLGTHARYMPPPPELNPPMRWGTKDGLKELVGNDVSSIENEVCQTNFYARSVEHLVDEYRTSFGPTFVTFANLEQQDQEKLYNDMTKVIHQYNQARNGEAIVEAEYLQSVAIRA